MQSKTVWTSALAIAAAALLAGCSPEDKTAAPEAPASQPAETPAQTQTESVEAETARFNAWLEEAFEELISHSPDFQTYLGRKTNYDKWTPATDDFAQAGFEMRMRQYKDMQEGFDRENLSPAAQLSYDIFVYQSERSKEGHPFRHHGYEFDQFSAPHSGIPAFMINQHRVSSREDAEAYIARLNGIKTKLSEHIANAEAQVAAGIAPPAWSYPQMIQTSGNAIKGAPFEEGAEPSTLLADFTKKVSALDLPQEDKDALVGEANDALLNSVKPAYEDLIAMLERHQDVASDDDGAWKLPDGAAYYAYRLKSMTTTDMSADEIHDLGLAEMDRIHGEMRAIMQTVGFEGTLQEFFVFMREDDQFYLPNTDEGRAEYLATATALIDDMKQRLDSLFLVKPKADLIVKRVEPFREQAAGKAFYQRPSADGSRPGTYYANLFDMRAMPIYQAAALAYHEGIPGHHMQIAIQQELEGVPSFRRFSGVTAYSEGWGLYSELIPKEIGLYEDPYSDFGRLAMELWRAARLVVDTGLHHKKWTRQEAIDYLVENTPNPESDCVKAIERYIVMPGQATAYKIGMLKILELREKAKSELGEAFDIREYHDAVLKNGPVPMAILEELVDDYIDGTAE